MGKILNFQEQRRYLTVNNQSISIDPYRECLYTQQWSVTTQKYIGHRQCVDNPCLVGGCTNSIWSCGYPYIPPASSAPRSYGIPPVCVQHPTGPSRGIPCLRLATMACPPPPRWQLWHAWHPIAPLCHYSQQRADLQNALGMGICGCFNGVFLLHICLFREKS